MEQMALMEDARANSKTAKTSEDREAHWRRILTQQDAEQVPLMADQRTTRVCQAARQAMASARAQGSYSLDASANVSTDDWKNSMLEQFRKMQGEVMQLKERSLSTESSQENVMSQDKAYRELYRRVDSLVTIVAEEFMRTTSMTKQCINPACQLQPPSWRKVVLLQRTQKHSGPEVSPASVWFQADGVDQ